MSVQACCRDRRKMGQVIDEIKILASNLDELRAEINALRTSCLGNKDSLHGNDFKRSKISKTDVMHRVRKYMKKITSMYSLRKGRKSGKNQEPYRCTNLDPPLSSFLNYIFRTGKKGDVFQVPAKIKYLRNQGNQTNERLENQHFVIRSPTASTNIKNTEAIHRQRPLFKKFEDEQNKAPPRKSATFLPKCSEISCELDLRVENPSFFPSAYEMNIFSDSYTFNDDPENTEVSLSNGNNKQSTKSTQTKTAKPGRKYKNLYFHSKHPNLCFSKIKNAVITRKIIRNSNESTFTLCGKVNDMKSYSHLRKERCRHCSCRRKRNNFAESNDRETNQQHFSMHKTDPRLRNNSYINNDALFQNFLSEEEPNLSSSSVSVDLEANISNSSGKIEEFPERRKPRTYVIRKTTQKRNRDNWLNHFERSIIYVGQTSDLSLSSYSFSDRNIRFD